MTGRKHDLPVMWDDRAVTWRGWEPEPVVILCPPQRKSEPKQCAHAEGTARERNVGLVAHSSLVTPAQLAEDAENRRRLGSLAHKRPQLATVRLFLTRCCHECRQDTVYDLETDEAWDLDDSDYSDQGSVDPETVQGALF